MAYLNYDKFALNQDEDGKVGDDLGEDTDTESDEEPLVELEEGNDYPDLGKESDEEE
jgi:hypothetical protein